MREVPRRLAGRARQTPAQNLSHQTSRASPPAQDAARGRQGPRPPPYDSAHAIAEAWAKATPPRQILHYAARDLCVALTEVEGRVPGAVITQLVQGWKQHLAPSTAHGRIYALRKILRQIDRELGTHLEEEATRTKKPEARKQVITQEDITKMLSIAPTHMQLFLHLMIGMALRFAEAKRAGPEHYDPQTATLRIETKGHRTRAFPVPPEIQQLFAVAPANGQGSYIERIYGRPIATSTLRQHWRKLAKEAGIDTAVTPHDLRRTAAVRVYTLTKDVLAVKALLGHDALMSTTRYLHPYDPAAMEAVKAALMRWTPKGETKQ